MTIQIYHKERWVYLKSKDGGEQTPNEKLAFDFSKISKKDREILLQDLENMKIQYIVK